METVTTSLSRIKGQFVNNNMSPHHVQCLYVTAIVMTKLQDGKFNFMAMSFFVFEKISLKTFHKTPIILNI